jgi:hypothetical protein
MDPFPRAVNVKGDRHLTQPLRLVASYASPAPDTNECVAGAHDEKQTSQMG